MIFTIDIVDVMVHEARQDGRSGLIVYLPPNEVSWLKPAINQHLHCEVRTLPGDKPWRMAIAERATNWARCFGPGIEIQENAQGKVVWGLKS